MARRIGKYKLTKKETSLHIQSPQVFENVSIKMTGLNTVSGSTGINGLFTTASNYFSSSKPDANGLGGFKVVCMAT
tara:strand:+ start:363 stop:590 length:228 start_codon:yes stop_codon:yes gene_type:complete